MGRTKHHEWLNQSKSGICIVFYATAAGFTLVKVVSV